jgi:hypothetical protein
MYKCKMFNSRYISHLEDMVNLWFAEMRDRILLYNDVKFTATADYYAVMITYVEREAPKYD